VLVHLGNLPNFIATEHNRQEGGAKKQKDQDPSLKPRARELMPSSTLSQTPPPNQAFALWSFNWVHSLPKP
jgi:hypothetical protein